jgi:hypothetical protein
VDRLLRRRCVLIRRLVRRSLGEGGRRSYPAMKPHCSQRGPEVAFHLRAPKDVAQFIFRLFQNALLSLRQIFAGAIDIEVQHRHGRLIRPRFTALAPFGGAFQRKRNLPRTPGSKHFRLQIQRVAVFGHTRRPAFARFLSAHQVRNNGLRSPLFLLLRTNSGFLPNPMEALPVHIFAVSCRIGRNFFESGR